MANHIISSTPAEKNINNVYAGSTIITDPIELSIVIQPGVPTTFVVRYAENGVIPTGNRIRLYKVGTVIEEIPIMGTPVIDYVNRTLTVQVSPSIVISADDTYALEFEVENI